MTDVLQQPMAGMVESATVSSQPGSSAGEASPPPDPKETALQKILGLLRSKPGENASPVSSASATEVGVGNSTPSSAMSESAMPPIEAPQAEKTSLTPEENTIADRILGSAADTTGSEAQPVNPMATPVQPEASAPIVSSEPLSTAPAEPSVPEFKAADMSTVQQTSGVVPATPSTTLEGQGTPVAVDMTRPSEPQPTPIESQVQASDALGSVEARTGSDADIQNQPTMAGLETTTPSVSDQLAANNPDQGIIPPVADGTRGNEDLLRNMSPEEIAGLKKLAEALVDKNTQAVLQKLSDQFLS